MKTIQPMLSLMFVVVVLLAGCSSDASSAMDDDPDIFFPRQLEREGGLHNAELIVESESDAQELKSRCPGRYWVVAE